MLEVVGNVLWVAADIVSPLFENGSVVVVTIVVTEAGRSVVTSVVGPLTLNVSVVDSAGSVVVLVTVGPDIVKEAKEVTVPADAVDVHKALIVTVDNVSDVPVVIVCVTSWILSNEEQNSLARRATRSCPHAAISFRRTRSAEPPNGRTAPARTSLVQEARMAMVPRR